MNLEKGQTVTINLPNEPEYHNRKGIVQRNDTHLHEVAIKFDDKPWNVVFDMDVIKESAQQMETPVLIELDEVLDFLSNEDEYYAYDQIKNHFSKPENQYHPKEKQAEPWLEKMVEKVKELNEWQKEAFGPQAILKHMKEFAGIDDEQPASPEAMIEAVSSEWTPMVGDEVITNRFETKCNGYSIFVHDMESLIGQKGTVQQIDNVADGVAKVHAYWWPLSALTLVKKAEKQIDSNEVEQKIEWYHDFNTDSDRLNIPSAKLLYRQGGYAKQVALKDYSEDELKEKQLPMRYRDLTEEQRCVSRQNENAQVELEKLLQLREMWLEIEAPGWAADWNKEDLKYCISRFTNDLEIVKIHGTYFPLSFPKEELAIKFKETFTDSLKMAFCLPQD